MIPRFSLYIFVLCLLSACNNDNVKQCAVTNTIPIESSYTQLFKLNSIKDGYILETKSSWENQTIKKYVLKRVDTNCESAIRIPVKRVIVFTGSSVFMIDTLGGINSIIGFGNSDYSGNAKLHDRLKSGKTKEIGDFSIADLETLIALEPDLIVVSGTGSPNPKISRLEEAGIPVLENVEWMEPHPLGMSEWIRVFGVLYDELEVADKIYDSIVRSYQELRDKAAKLPMGSRIIYDKNFGGSWYVPGQKSFIGTIFKDANIPYVYESNESSGSIVKDVEIMIQKHLDDTVWVAPGSNSLSELKSEDERHALFLAFKLGNVFQYDKRIGINGTTLYWEERVLRCDWLLEDFINISQDGGNAKNLHFFRKLE